MSMKRLHCMLLAGLVYGSSSFAEELEQRRYLLLDARIVEDAQNAELTLGTVEKYGGNPLFGEDKPWEKRFDNLYANVIYDDEEQIYKSWYSPLSLTIPQRG